MTDLVRWLLGVDAPPEWRSGEWHVEFHALPQGPWAVFAVLLGLGAVAGVVFLYRLEQRDLPKRPRLLLAGLRTVVLGLAVFMLLEMVIVLTTKESIPSRLLVLIDGSESMALRDPYSDESTALAIAEALSIDGADGKAATDRLRERTRSELAGAALEPLLEPLGDGRQLFLYRFASKLEALPETDPFSAPETEGQATALGDAMAQALAKHRGQPIAAVVVATDGRSNAGQDPLTVAQRAGADGIPIHALAIGGSEGPRNVRLAELDANPVVFVRDSVELAVLIDARNMKDAPATVSLEQRKDDGPWQETARKEITLGEDALVQRIVFPYTPTKIGKLEFRATVLNAGPELTTDDNVATAAVEVIRQQIRVLLIAGAPSSEMQFLRNALLRDPQIEFASWLQSAAKDYENVGDKPIRRLPVTKEELNHYDALVMLDPDARALGAAWPEMITEFVGQAGGGLIYVAGELYTPQLFNPTNFDFDGSGGVIDDSWVRILPVVREPGLYQSTAEVRLGAMDTWALELTTQGYEDQIFRFDENASRNREVLASLPGMYWHFPVTRPKPGATVLAQHGDPRMRNAFGCHVLMATHLYGPGRAVFVGFDSTHRWRYLHEEYFDGFWARLIDRVGRGKVLGGRYPFSLSTDKNVYKVGDRVTVAARFLGVAEETAGLTSLSGDVELGGESTVSLTLEPVGREAGVFETSFLAERIGSHTVRVLPTVAADPGSGPRAATVAFRVEPPKQEIDNPTLDRPLLEDMARASGGAVHTLDQARSLPAAIGVKEVERVLESRDELWDAPLLFGSLLLLLTLEWVLRKHYRLA